MARTSTNRTLVIAAVMFGFLAFASVRLIANDDKDWKVLGETRVDQHMETGEIKVGADAGLFKRIKLEVRGADVEFKRVTVAYANGADEVIEVRDKIKRGGETRPIDLKGSNRAIKRVVFLYKADGNVDRDAHVVLVGHR